MNDPVKGCDVYKNIGCAHVDGFLCDYPNCSILKDYKMNELIVKNWITVPRANVERALKWAKRYPQYITNDYAIIGGRVEHYQKGDDYDNFDFFFVVSDVMTKFESIFGVEE